MARNTRKVAPHIGSTRNSGSGSEELSCRPEPRNDFFQNLTSFGVGYFTIDENRGEGFFCKSELDAMPSVMETEHVRVVRFARPLKIMMDGKRQEGAVLRP